jgi:hypothetical protein
MAKENPVYFKLEYEESIESKKDILSTEVSLLNLVKSLNEYKSIREDEFKIKSQIYKAIKKLNLDMKKTQASFPFIKIPKIIQRQSAVSKEETPRKERINQDLESELREIQSRLASLGQ